MILEGYIVIDISHLKALQGIRYDSIEKNTLINVSEISINKASSMFERIDRFISEVKNPYIMQCGDTVVEVAFSDNEKTVDSQMKNYLKSLKTG